MRTTRRPKVCEHITLLAPARPGVRPTYLSYIYDADELDDRMHLDVAKDLQRGTVERLQRMLHSRNPFVQCFKAINMAEFGPNVNIVLHADVEGVDGRLYTTPTADNIAAIIPGHFDDEPTHHRREDFFVNDIVLNPIRNIDKPFRTNAKPRFTDPLHFVLLFPSGELGWRPGLLRARSW
ncbi:hypothetical protein WJX77_006688 [Trebouxia sp. C0004]